MFLLLILIMKFPQVERDVIAAVSLNNIFNILLNIVI